MKKNKSAEKRRNVANINNTETEDTQNQEHMANDDACEEKKTKILVAQNEVKSLFTFELLCLMVVCIAIGWHFFNTQGKNDVLCFEDDAVKIEFASQLDLKPDENPFDTKEFRDFSSKIDRIVESVSNRRVVLQCSACVGNCLNITNEVVSLYDSKKP